LRVYIACVPLTCGSTCGTRERESTRSVNKDVVIAHVNQRNKTNETHAPEVCVEPTICWRQFLGSEPLSKKHTASRFGPMYASSDNGEERRREEID
jgi:hypothetical protein